MAQKSLPPFARRLQAARRALGQQTGVSLSDQQIADRMRREHKRPVSRQTVGNWFSGRKKTPPGHGDLDALCSILEVTPDSIVYGRRDEPPPAHTPTVEEQVGERLWWASVQEGVTIAEPMGAIGAGALDWLEAQLRRQLQRAARESERNDTWVRIADALTDVEREIHPTAEHPKLRRAIELSQSLVRTATPDAFPIMHAIGAARARGDDADERAPARGRQQKRAAASERKRAR